MTKTPVERAGVLKQGSRSSFFPTIVALFSLKLATHPRVVVDSSLKKSLLAPDDDSDCRVSSESAMGCISS